MNQNQRDDVTAKLDTLGEEQVRQLSLTGGLPSQWTALIADWLKNQKGKPTTGEPA